MYLHREALGSVGLVTDNLGGELERTYFDPFGEKADVFGKATSPLLGDVKLGFTGHRHDDELCLIDMRGRVYDPTQKRFLTPDPHVPDPLSGQSYNRFAYVANNPLRYTDPTGFLPAAGDLKRPAPTQPDGGASAACPTPWWPKTLTAAETVVIAKADDTGGTSPPPPPGPTAAQQEAKWTQLLMHFAWGAGRRLFRSVPPVAMALQIRHNIEVAGTALSQAANGEWDLAGNTLMELPQENAEAAARILTGPIEAALSIPESVSTAIDSNADPEMRGEATVATAQAIVTVVVTAAGVAAGAKAVASGKLHGNNLNTTKPAKGYSLRDKATGKVLKYGETTRGAKRYSKSELDNMNAKMRFEASGTKRQMHDWQHRKILDYKANNGGQRPSLNKTDF